MIPEKFLERMKRILGEDTGRFVAALEEEAVKGLRVNGVKTDSCDLSHISEVKLSPISYAPDGYIVERGEKLGNTPEHHAGAFYMQDPGAMATVNAVDIKEGYRVLDVCAAPGGKSSQMAAKIGESGLLYANEYVPKRAKIIVGNLERLGVRNAIVTSLDSGELKKTFSAYFDLVLCDAPCSGEGMFRKYGVAEEEWSEENVAACARRQREILDNSAPCVKGGGYLLYSTCTYSPEENEMTVAAFLDSHPDFSLVRVRDEVIAATLPGLSEYSDKYDMTLTRRFYPHVSPGEGQYIALMKRDENCGYMPTTLYKSAEKLPSKDETAAAKKFLSDNMKVIPGGKLIKQGDGIAIVPSDAFIPKSAVFMAGVMIGEVRGNLLFPHHQLFCAYGGDMKRREELSLDDARVEKYLRGEEIDAVTSEGSGYLSVTYRGLTLGGGKLSSGKIKNHYPKGLRKK